MQSIPFIIKINDQKLIEETKSVFTRDSFRFSKSFKRLCRQNQQLCKTLEDLYNIKFSNVIQTFKEFVKAIVFQQSGYSVCNICGKVFKNGRAIRSKNLYCSLKCMHIDNTLNIRRIETFKKNNPTQIFSKKMKDIWAKKLSDPQQLEKFKNCIKTAVQDKYGVDNVYQLEQVKKKRNATMKQRYGAQQTMHCEQLKNKFKTTVNQLKSFYSQSYKSHFKNTMKQRYGVQYASQSNVIKQKTIKNNMQQYGMRHPNNLIVWEKLLMNADIVEPLFTKQEYINKDTEYRWKCVMCNNQFEASITSHHLTEKAYRLPRCPNCFPKLAGISYLQKQVVQFCKQYFPNLLENDRKIIKPYELDIVIPQIKLAIQFNGNYWHSIQAGIQKETHLNKVLNANQQGYRLLYIWQDQWNNNKEEIKLKLIEIFENRQNLQNCQHLEFSWYNGDTFKIVKYYQPEIKIHGQYQTFNCGYIDICFQKSLKK